MEHQQQYVGIDLHRRRSVIVRMAADGEVIECVRSDNDPVALSGRPGGELSRFGHSHGASSANDVRPPQLRARPRN